MQASTCLRLPTDRLGIRARSEVASPTPRQVVDSAADWELQRPTDADWHIAYGDLALRSAV